MSDSSEANLIELMAECADQVLAGAGVAACLERHPEHAAALEPLLGTLLDVHALRAVPPRSAAVAAERRAQFVAAAQALRSPVPQGRRAVALLSEWGHSLSRWLAGSLGMRHWPRLMPSGLALALTIVLLSGLLLTGIVTASAGALPGNLLYPVKTTTERVRVLLAADAQDRDRLLVEMTERRIGEAKAVVELKRKVATVPLEGVIEAIDGNTWQVSGLKVTITSDSLIIGSPQVGGRVQGQASAPGDGSLVLRYAEVEPPGRPQSAVSPAPTATAVPPAPARPAAPASATATPTSAASSVADFLVRSGQNAIPMRYNEPPDPPTQEPTATFTATPTATRTHTPTRTATPTPTATPEPPREQVKGRIIGYVVRIEGGWWTIDDRTVEVNAFTVFSGNPTVGSKIDAIVEIKPNGAYVALLITELAPPNAPPENLEFTEVVEEISGALWKIGGWQVLVSGDTVLENNPGVGDLVEVKAQRYANGEVRALRITAVRDEVQFQGIIDAMGGDAWQIGGNTVIVRADTQIIGEPAVGALVQVVAIQMPDGSLVATVIGVVAPPAP